MQPAPPAPAARAADPDDHVADLAGAAAPEPRLAVEDQAAADARCPRTRRAASLYGSPGAELELGVGGDLDVVADEHRRSELARQRRAELEAARPNPGRLRACEIVPGFRVDNRPGEPTPTPGSADGVDARRVRTPP